MSAARQRRYRKRKADGRLVLPGFHVADVEWPQKLIQIGWLRADQEDDTPAITKATIAFVDAVKISDDER